MRADHPVVLHSRWSTTAASQHGGSPASPVGTHSKAVPVRWALCTRATLRASACAWSARGPTHPPPTVSWNKVSHRSKRAGVNGTCSCTSAWARIGLPENPGRPSSTRFQNAVSLGRCSFQSTCATSMKIGPSSGSCATSW